MPHEHAPPAPRDLTSAFKWALALNTGFVVLEAGFGFLAGSLALLADAAHNLTDVAGLLIAWGAVTLTRRPPTRLHTYGLGRTTILAALANAVTILIGVGAILWESVRAQRRPRVPPRARGHPLNTWDDLHQGVVTESMIYNAKPRGGIPCQRAKS